MSENDDKTVANMDELLHKLGIYGRFQFLAFLGLRLIFCAFAFSLMQMAYAGMTPGWHCIINTSGDVFQSSSFSGSVEDGENVSDFISTIVHTTNFGNKTFKVCNINGTKCDSYKFIGSFRTVVTEWSLICDKTWVKQIIISIQMMGLLSGSVLAGHLGDHFGRKNIVYLALLMCSVGECITGFSISWKMFAACKMFVGIALGMIPVTVYPYLLEFCPPGWRSVLTGFPAFAAGVSLFAGVAYALEDWSSLHFTSAGLILPFLFGWFYFPESPRWLAVRNKLDMAQKSVNMIARCNRKPLPPGTMSLIAKIAREEKETRQTGRVYTLYDIFSTWQMAIVTLSMAYISFSFSVVLFGINFGISTLYGNVFLNIFLSAILQIPLQVSSSYAVHRCGRRCTSFLFTFLSIVGSAGCFIVIFAAQELSSKGAIISGLCITTRIAVGVAFNVTNLWCNELYPTAVRGLGYSCFMMSFRLGAVVSPFLVNFDGMAMTTYVVMTFLLITSGLLILITRETKGVPLAESTAKAEKCESQADVCLLEDKSHQNYSPDNSTKV